MNPNDIARTIGTPQQAPMGPSGSASPQGPPGDPTQMLSMMFAQLLQKGGPQALQQVFQKIASAPDGAEAIQTILTILTQPAGGQPMPQPPMGMG